jgi:hypothetical protein
MIDARKSDAVWLTNSVRARARYSAVDEAVDVASDVSVASRGTIGGLSLVNPTMLRCEKALTAECVH